MINLNLFKSKNGIFSKKEYEKKKKIEKQKKMKFQKELKKKYKEEEKKRKVINRISKERKKEIKLIRREEKLKQKNKPKTENKPKITYGKPTLFELEKHLLKLTENYDTGIKKSRNLYEELIFLGLTDSGLKEFKGESIKKRNKRIKKINELHKILMNILERNKDLEKSIEILDNKIREEKNKLRKK